jgi:hypothetical protein
MICDQRMAGKNVALSCEAMRGVERRHVAESGAAVHGGKMRCETLR